MNFMANDLIVKSCGKCILRIQNNLKFGGKTFWRLLAVLNQIHQIQNNNFRPRFILLRWTFQYLIVYTEGPVVNSSFHEHLILWPSSIDFEVIPFRWIQIVWMSDEVT